MTGELGQGSSHLSARYGVPCETCKAEKDDPCRTLRTGKVTDTHMARLDAFNALAAANRERGVLTFRPRR